MIGKAESTSLSTAQSLVTVRGAAALLQKQPPEEVPEPEEDEDHDRHNGGNQAHHLQQL